MIGHWLGLPQLDRWIMSRLLRLGPEFTEMVDRHRNMKLEPVFAAALRDWQMHSLWCKMGYVVVGRPKAPEPKFGAPAKRPARVSAKS